jgi:hypothetical protein
MGEKWNLKSQIWDATGEIEILRFEVLGSKTWFSGEQMGQVGRSVATQHACQNPRLQERQLPVANLGLEVRMHRFFEFSLLPCCDECFAPGLGYGTASGG